MRAVVQKVSKASVTVDKQVVSSIGEGLVVLLGIGINDVSSTHEKLADKIVNLRIFPDSTSGKMDQSLLDLNGEILVISQFTLYSNIKKGRRPSFTEAAQPKDAQKLYNDFCNYLETHDLKVMRGVFGAHMDVELTNSGPVTITINEETDL
jgi:D-tyrosyl-tRNA(Tyr) deacylase